MWRLYDWECTSCGRIEEILTKNDEIPECCGNAMIRLIPGPVYTQDIVCKLESDGRSVPSKCIPPKMARWV